ncbi:MAG: chorismate lyase [Methanobrevibacter sp.]|nr:chorismate lyase [Methanobrevibacter sp.]
MNTKGSIVKNEIHNEIKKIEAEHNLHFSNTQKVLLSIEGSITAILDVLYGKVSIFTLDQHFERADDEKAEMLNLSNGDEVHHREVIIFGHGKPMIYARSYIALPRCSKEAHEDIIKGKIPIGRLLKKYKVESRREIKEIYIEEPSAMLKELFKTDEDFVSRDYVVIEHGERIMWTKESFPISYFKKEI